MTSTTTHIDVRRAPERFHSKLGWLDSWHSFSFSTHWDPSNTGHGLLFVHNDDVIAPGTGFPLHAHRDTEIVTWVLDGALEHRDTLGSHGIIRPGHAQRMSAGTGIRHSEMNASGDEPLRLVQMWVRPDARGVTPSYEQVDVNDRLSGGGLVAVASGQPGLDSAVRIHQRGATLWVGRLVAGEAAVVPPAPHAHLYIARGSARLAEPSGEPVSLGEGDAVRATATGPLEVTAGDGGAEVLVWATD